MLFLFAHCWCTQCKQSMNKPRRWIGSHKHLDKFCRDHAGQTLCGCVALWDQLPHDCLFHAMDGWRDGWMDGKLHKKRQWRPLLYVIWIPTLWDILEYGGACKGILTSQNLSIFLYVKKFYASLLVAKLSSWFPTSHIVMHSAWSIYNIGWIRSSKQTLFIILW